MVSPSSKILLQATIRGNVKGFVQPIRIRKIRRKRWIKKEILIEKIGIERIFLIEKIQMRLNKKAMDGFSLQQDGASWQMARSVMASLSAKFPGKLITPDLSS